MTGDWGTSARVDEDDLRRRAQLWVERHCAEQGIPVKVTDPATIEKIAAILASAREKRLRA